MVTTGNLPAPVQQSFDYKLLSVPTPDLIHKIAAMKRNKPRNSGPTMRFRRYNQLNTALVPLGNTGVTPPGQNLTAVDIDATISFYGTYIAINEQVTLQNQDTVLNEAAIRLGVSLRMTEDALTRDMLRASAAMINCVNGVNGDNPTEITLPDVQEITRTLLTNNAKRIMDNIEGENKFGTGPVRSSYFALCHSEISTNLENVARFRSKYDYPAPNEALDSEWGAIDNLRFLVSSVGSKDANASMLGADVYNIFCVGLEGYACIEQDGYSASFIYRPPIFDGPLALNCSVGYKMAQAPVLTNDLWVLNLRATLA